MTDTRPPKKTETLEVRMPHETKRAFLEACRSEGRTASEIVRGFVDGYLARAARRTSCSRGRSKLQGSLSMIFTTREGRRAAATAVIGALGLVGLTMSPSAAQLDVRAVFDAMDADQDGRVSLQEFATPPSGAGDTMVFIRADRISAGDGGVVTESAEEFWLPVAPPADAGAGGERHEVRRVRRVENGEVITDDVQRLPLDERALAGLRRQEFQRFDDDGDGAVDFAEFETRHTSIIANTFRRLDADGDGRLASEEFLAIPAALGFDDLPPPPAPGGVTAEGFARLDRDGDGAVTLEEFAAGPGAR